MFNQVFGVLKGCAVWINNYSFQEGLKELTDGILFGSLKELADDILSGSPTMNVIGPVEYLRLFYTDSNHWPIKVSTVYSDW